MRYSTGSLISGMENILANCRCVALLVLQTG
jgi:hypothetical protein